MRKCPVCNFINVDTRQSCLKCNATLVQIDVEQVKGADKFDFTGRGMNSLARLFHRIQRSLAVDLDTNLPYRFPFLAAFLGFLPGLGQIYNHQPKKILFLTFPFALFVCLATHFITTPYWANILIIAAIAVSMISFTDALLTAGRINGQVFSTRQSLAALTYPVFLLGLFGFFCGVMAFLHWPFFTLFYINWDYMEPGLHKGDRIAGEGLTYIVFNPKPGDVVHYDPPGYDVYQGSDHYMVDPQNGWERVIAIGGETLKSVGRVLYVDGKRLSKEYYPIAPNDLPADFEITCPKKKYLILIGSKAKGFDIQVMKAVTSPSLGSESWAKACIVNSHDIFDRSLFIYTPAIHRKMLSAHGPRFVDAASPPR